MGVSLVFPAECYAFLYSVAGREDLDTYMLHTSHVGQRGFGVSGGVLHYREAAFSVYFRVLTCRTRLYMLWEFDLRMLA